MSAVFGVGLIPVHTRTLRGTAVAKSCFEDGLQPAATVSTTCQLDQLGSAQSQRDTFATNNLITLLLRILVISRMKCVLPDYLEDLAIANCFTDF
jgi:hypothetical protein